MGIFVLGFLFVYYLGREGWFNLGWGFFRYYFLVVWCLFCCFAACIFGVWLWERFLVLFFFFLADKAIIQR